MNHPMKNNFISIAIGLASTVLLLAGLSGCSSSSSPAGVSTVTVSGKISSTANPSPEGEPGVTVQGYYSDTATSDAANTVADGTYTLTVERNRAVSIKLSKGTFTTLNSEKLALTADITDFNEDLPTETEAEDAIAAAFGPGPTLSGQAWLAVNVIDTNTDAEIPGVAFTITGTPAPTDVVYTDCAGAGTGEVVTVVDGPPCDRGPMYFAYFDTDSSEVTVSDGVSSKLAPIRRGEVTFLEFEQ